MSENYTDGARAAIQLAERVAARSTGGPVDTEHVLLGVLSADGSVAEEVLTARPADTSAPRARSHPARTGTQRHRTGRQAANRAGWSASPYRATPDRHAQPQQHPLRSASPPLAGYRPTPPSRRSPRGGRYVNFLRDVGSDRVQAAYRAVRLPAGLRHAGARPGQRLPAQSEHRTGLTRYGRRMRPVDDPPERNEDALTARIAAAMRGKLVKGCPPAGTKRDAHPKHTGLLEGVFAVDADLPEDLRVGVFAEARSYRAWVRTSNASDKPQPDYVRDFRGLAIKLLDVAAEKIRPSSPLEIRYWSTTPYRFGADRVVKYSLLPTSGETGGLSAQLPEDYLSRAMAQRLSTEGVSFDFAVQLRGDGMPVHDAAPRWDETDSPFVRVATLTIPAQDFRTEERDRLAEVLSFSPAHARVEHRPIGPVNRARMKVYRANSEFRHRRSGTPSGLG